MSYWYRSNFSILKLSRRHFTVDGSFLIVMFAPRSKNGWWGEPVQFFVQHINNCQSFEGSPIQNGSICALPQRGGRTQLRATQKLSEGPYIETETYPKEMEMSASVPFLRHLAALELHPHHIVIHNHRGSQCEYTSRTSASPYTVFYHQK